MELDLVKKTPRQPIAGGNENSSIVTGPRFPPPKYEGMAYITPLVKLELGARGDPRPTARRGQFAPTRRRTIPKTLTAP